MNILRYFTDTPCAVIVKHNNPCGAARAQSLEQAYKNAYMADIKMAAEMYKTEDSVVKPVGVKNFMAFKEFKALSC